MEKSPIDNSSTFEQEKNKDSGEIYNKELIEGVEIKYDKSRPEVLILDLKSNNFSSFTAHHTTIGELFRLKKFFETKNNSDVFHKVNKIIINNPDNPGSEGYGNTKEMINKYFKEIGNGTFEINREDLELLFEESNSH